MQRVRDVLGPWAWLFGSAAAGVLIMLVVLNLTAVRSVDALPALPTREPTATDVPPPQSLQITLSHSDSGDVVVSAAPVAEGPPSSVAETPTPVAGGRQRGRQRRGRRVVTVSQPDDTPQDELVEPELTATPFLVVTVTRPTVRPTLPPQVTVVIVATPELSQEPATDEATPVGSDPTTSVPEAPPLASDSSGTPVAVLESTPQPEDTPVGSPAVPPAGAPGAPAAMSTPQPGAPSATDSHRQRTPQYRHHR